jgi:hypothetical protein
MLIGKCSTTELYTQTQGSVLKNENMTFEPRLIGGKRMNYEGIWKKNHPAQIVRLSCTEGTSRRLNIRAE